MLCVEQLVLSVAFLSVVVVLFRLWLTRKLSFWKEFKIKQWDTTSIFGNFGNLIRMNGNEADMADTFYKQLGSGKYGGYYFFWKPILMVKDQELIKRLTITDFKYFTDRPSVCNIKERGDNIVRSMFSMGGSEWKSRRTVFSHFFTPSKIKLVHDVTTNNCSKLYEEFNLISTAGEDVEIETMAAVITINVITSGFMGVNVQEQTKFKEAAAIFSNPSISTLTKMCIYNIHPEFNKLFRITTFDKKLYEMFSSFVKDVVKAKEEQQITGADFFSFLIKAKNGEIKGLEDICHGEMVGHIFSFFIAGHDTTSITTGFALYHLSKDQEIQSRLRNELIKIIKDNNGQLNYDILKGVAYLNNIISETARMYPVLGVIKRVSNQEYKIDEHLTIPKGTEIIFPVRAMHYDPNYFTDPEKFNPDRFAENDPPEVYMPFGKGPRICIGKRFAECVIRACLALLVLNYEFLPSDKNKLPFQYEPSVVVTSRPVGGLWVKMKKIENEFNF